MSSASSAALVRLKIGGTPIDGVFGPLTEQAVKNFQAGEGIAVDGIVGPITWSHLPAYREASPTLKKGSLGPDVALLQQVMTNATVPYPGPIDGIFGAKTDAAVRSSHSEIGVTVDGIVGDETWLSPAHAAGATLESLSGIFHG